MKYKRKSFRKYKKTHKRSHKGRYKKSGYKTFKRKLNNVAEKKSAYFANPLAGDTQAHTLSTDNTVAFAPGAGVLGFIYVNLVQGTSRVTRVGNKIFIRKIVVKGEIYNQIGTNCASAIVGCWVFREKSVGSMGTFTRNSVIGALPFTLMPDLAAVPYKILGKKSAFIQAFNGASVNNTVTCNGNQLGYCFKYKFKFNFFKEFSFDTVNYKCQDGMGDIIVVPWIDSGVYNTIGTGINNSCNIRITYTDV